YVKNSHIFREPSNWARTPYEVGDHPVEWRAGIERDGLEGLYSGVGQNACNPRHYFRLALVAAPADSIAFCDTHFRSHYPNVAWINSLDGFGYYLAFWRKTYGGNDAACPPDSEAASNSNYAEPGDWHHGGATVTFFDGHARWMKEETLRTPPAEYQKKLR